MLLTTMTPALAARFQREPIKKIQLVFTSVKEVGLINSCGVTSRGFLLNFLLILPYIHVHPNYIVSLMLFHQIEMKKLCACFFLNCFSVFVYGREMLAFVFFEWPSLNNRLYLFS